jgi:S-adenosylmethionine synthetase
VFLHHKTDQGEIVAGETMPKFGGGKLFRPIFILIDGRATKRFNNTAIRRRCNRRRGGPGYLRFELQDPNLNAMSSWTAGLAAGSTDSATSSSPAKEGSPGQRYLVRRRPCPVQRCREYRKRGER